MFCMFTTKSDSVRKRGMTTPITPAKREPFMECRSDCGACCTAPSISSPIPGMPDGKPANTPCVQLDEQQRCKLFRSPLRPKVCAGLQPSREMCGSMRAQAMVYLIDLERQTAP